MRDENKQRSPLVTLLALALALAVSVCGGQSDAGPEATEAPGMADEGARAVAPEDAAESPAVARGSGGAERERREPEHRASGAGEEEEGEHEEGAAEGEESGAYISVAEAWDETRGGTRLTLVYDPGYDTFQGRVYNAGQARLCGVRVEVHLGDGTELGPTARTDLEPGASGLVELPVGGRSFDRWTAHAETSPCSG